MNDRALAAAATALALVLAGCGGGDEDEGGGGDRAAETQTQTAPDATSVPEGDAGAAEQTVRNYLDGLAEGDGEKVCDQFTAEGRQQLDEIGGCAEFYDGLLSQLTDVQRDELGEIDPQVHVSGDRATAMIPNLENEAQQDTLNLRKEGGEWKIADTESPAAGQ